MVDVERYIVAQDPQLVTWALEGDNQAFEFLITRYKESIYRLVVARLGGGNTQDAQDILQESFIKVYINLHRYDPNYTFGQWIYTIVRNTLVDFQRRRTDTLSLDDDRSLPPEECSPNPEQSIINRQKRTQIELGISQLKPAQQELFRMRFIEEYSYEEIADKLQMPLGSVKTNIHRTRAQMCRFITEHDEL